MSIKKSAFAMSALRHRQGRRKKLSPATLQAGFEGLSGRAEIFFYGYRL
jgi:hypothetical protein